MGKSRSKELGKERAKCVNLYCDGCIAQYWFNYLQKKVYGVLSRHLGFKALFINLFITIPIVLEARNSTGVAGAPYGEHGPLQGRAGAAARLCLCSGDLISMLSTEAPAFGAKTVLI